MKKISTSIIALSIICFVIACGNKKGKDCNIDTPITYTSHVEGIIKTNCFECHSKEVFKVKAARNKIYDYKSLKNMAESGILFGSLNHEEGFIPMPYKKGHKIDECDIQTIKAWIDSGLKE